MAAIRSNAGGQLLNQYLVARIFAFDDDQSEARAACVVFIAAPWGFSRDKGRRGQSEGPEGPHWSRANASNAARAKFFACCPGSRRFFCCTGNQAAEQATEQTANVAERTLPDPSTHAPTPSDRTRETRGATRDDERNAGG